MESMIGQTLGQYQLIEQIGKGGMATVYKAYQPALDRYVAVKILPPYFAHEAGFTERFTREAQAIAKLDHPNILPVYDFGKQNDISFIVMKYVPAGTLQNKMGESVPLAKITEIIEQVAGALDTAHEQGILHRDVKPGNILLDDKDWVYLSDFGLAKMVEGSVHLTGTGVGVGTPAYMSPEQGKGLAVDARTDVYALGVVLFEMLTGRIPYKAETPMAVVIKHVTDPIPVPTLVNPNIPEAVERVLLKALAKDRDQRFASAGAMARTLRQAITGFDPGFATLPTPSDPDATVYHQGGRPPSPPPHAVERPAADADPSPPPAERPVEPKSTRRLPIAAGIGGLAIAAICLVAGLVYFFNRQSSPIPATVSATPVGGIIQVASENDTATSNPSATPTDTPLPTHTPTKPPTNTPEQVLPANTTEPTPFPSPISTPTPIPTVISAPVAPTPMSQEIGLMIDDFENPNELNDFEINRNAGNDAVVNLVGPPHLNQGQQALSLEFDIRNDRPNHYIGFDRAIPVQDWSEYISLCLWVESDGSNRTLVVQFGESKFKFWKNVVSLAGMGSGDHCVSLQADHQIDLTAIGYYGVYVEGPPQGKSVIYLDNVRVVGQPTPPPTPTSTPSATPSPPSWPDTGLHPDGRFADIWSTLNAESGELGYPVMNREGGSLCAREKFERGYMLWFDRPGDQDLVFAAIIPNQQANSGSKAYKFDDIWPGNPEYWCDEATARAPLGPKRGFGMLWCIHPDFRADIGNATEEEVGGPDNPRCEAQIFQGGTIVHNPLDTVYWVFINNGGWYRFEE